MINHKYLIAIIFLMLVICTPLRAGEDPTSLAKSLLVEFTEAVISGPETLAPLLAPEYQIMRSNSVGYDRDEYLKHGLKTLEFVPVFSHQELVVTSHEDILVVRYMLEIDEKIDGHQIQKRAPRLTVFRNIDGNWKVVAHSNFAVVPED